MKYEDAVNRELEDRDLPQTEESFWFCEDCLLRLPQLQPPVCRVCARPSMSFLDGSPQDLEVCTECLRQPPPFEWARALYEYGGAVKEAIHRLKSRGDESVARGLGALLSTDLYQVFPDPALSDQILTVPVPQDPSRARSPHHAALLARHLTSRLGLESPNIQALGRNRPTTPQRRLSRRERLTNLEGVFVAHEKIVSGRSILLVDDVMTTGATVGESSRALRSAGAERVYVVVVCRTL